MRALMQSARNAQELGRAETWLCSFRCAMLASPDTLAEGEPGSDCILTTKDFDAMSKWLLQLKALNLPFFAATLERERFHAASDHAIQHVFYTLDNTYQPGHPELLLWYYAGHGMSAGSEFTRYTDGCAAKAEGGELYLHDRGVLPLEDLVRRFEQALSSPSKAEQASGPKENKHLLVILDSCYSQTQANALRLPELRQRLGKNHLTVQTASPDEALSGYFTPVFLRLQDPQTLRGLSEKYEVDSDEASEPRGCAVTSTFFSRDSDLKPQYYYELPAPRGPKTEATTIFLFPDPAFFQYCASQLLRGSPTPTLCPRGPRKRRHEGNEGDEGERAHKVRTLHDVRRLHLWPEARRVSQVRTPGVNLGELRGFLWGDRVKIKDYKLRTLQEPHGPTALFLLGPCFNTIAQFFDNPASHPFPPSGTKTRLCVHFHMTRDRLLVRWATVYAHVKMSDDVYEEVEPRQNLEEYQNELLPTGYAKLINSCRDFVRADISNENWDWNTPDTLWSDTRNAVGRKNQSFRAKKAKQTDQQIASRTP
eukprot:TRINITY_DN17514_c0_g1_i1.p1 TRINITY_DN17514_c0_g1~~TRINITY_DN17514_c0_g1_i1.p1  ORF type:complete len:537 (+),score=57.12 TRINITY_DN17514_c0_g1_i1:208-1818(+)